MKAPGKHCTPANAVSHFENRHFLTHRPPARPRGILCVETIGSPHRGILCVEKIGSAAPELQEWPGAPSKPVKSTNGPFYWLTRKRAPPCRGTLSGDLVAGPCRGTPVKKLSPGPDRRLAWYCYRGTDSRRSHLTYTPTERDHTGPKKISFGKKQSMIHTQIALVEIHPAVR